MSTRTIPSLDGLRAVSIGLVLLAHAQGTPGFPGWIPGAIANHGKLGVHIFFVISGFLITTLLLKERSDKGSISLGAFYGRRTLRIFPPLYVFLAILFAATLAGFLSIPPINFLVAATFTTNYFPLKVWVTNHLWTLSVEEQFYLAWPLTLKLAGNRKAFWGAGLLAAGAPLFCLFLYSINPTSGVQVSLFFPFVADAIAAGCVTAGMLPWLRDPRRSRWFTAPPGDLVIPLIFLLDLGRNHPRIQLGVTETALNCCICYAVVRYTALPEGAVGRLLNTPVLAYIGRLSYSLYLWQQVFMNPADPRQSFPLNLAESFGCALVSYYLVERPITKFRKRLRQAPTLLPAEESLCETA